MSAEMTAEALEMTAALCKRFEGFRSKPYICPAGVATIGYGNTRYLDGRRVLLTDKPVTEREAKELLVATIKKEFLVGVLRACPNINTPGRLAAVTDFAYNLGLGALRASTLRRRVNEEDWDAVPGELRKWVRGGGRVLPGLVARREAEIILI